MTVSAASKLFTIEEYLELEQRSLTKHEYDKGKIIEIAGGTIAHNQLSGKIITQLNIAADTSDETF